MAINTKNFTLGVMGGYCFADGNGCVEQRYYCTATRWLGRCGWRPKKTQKPTKDKKLHKTKTYKRQKPTKDKGLQGGAGWGGCAGWKRVRRDGVRCLTAMPGAVLSRRGRTAKALSPRAGNLPRLASTSTKARQNYHCYAQRGGGGGDHYDSSKSAMVVANTKNNYFIISKPFISNYVKLF